MTKKKKRSSVFVVCAVLLILLISGIAYYRVVNRAVRAVDSIDSLQVLLATDKWSVPRPPRTDWKPGTVLYVKDGNISVYQTDDEAFPEADAPRIEASAPYPETSVDLDCSVAGNAQFLFAKGSAKDHKQQRFQLRLEKAYTRYIARKNLETALKKNKQLSEDAASRPPASLYVITEVLIASTLRITNSAKTTTDTQQSADLEDLKASLKVNVEAAATSEYVVSEPITVGYKAVTLAAVATQMGSAAGNPELLDMTLSDQHKLGQLQQTPLQVDVEPPQVSVPVHVLAIGLDLYASDKAAGIGGMLPGAPFSAALVASRAQDLFGSDSRCSVELLAPTLASGQLRNRLTLADITKHIILWKERVSPKERDSGQNAAFVIYCCGHGVADSTTGFVNLMPEKYEVANPHGGIKEGGLSWAAFMSLPKEKLGCLLMLDCCRMEDGYLASVRKNEVWSHSRSNSIERAKQQRRDMFPGPGLLVMHSVNDNSAAFTIPYDIGIHERELGPLSVAFDLAVSKVIRERLNLTMHSFSALLMQKQNYRGVEIRPSAIHNVWTEKTRVDFNALNLLTWKQNDLNEMSSAR